MTGQFLSLAAGTAGCFFAILCFAVYIEVPRSYLLRAGLVGALGGLTYLLAVSAGQREVAATFLSALAVAVLSHIFARRYKAPVTLFLIPGILPTVPGAGMYRTAYYLIMENGDAAVQSLVLTLEIAAGIALAIFLADGVFEIIQKQTQRNNPR